MPTVQIPIGVNLNVTANEVYSIPCAPCYLSSASPIGYGPTFTGPFANYVANTPIKCGFVKPSANDVIFLTRIKPKAKAGAALYLSYPELVLKDKPSYYWRLNETSGLVASDSIGGAHGTISGGVTLGQSGSTLGDKSFLFNGTTGKIVTPTFTMARPFTIESWIKTTVDAGTFPTIWSNAGGGTSGGANLVLWAGNAAVTQEGATASNVRGTRILTDGQWHHVVGVGTATDLLIYVDGQLEKSVASITGIVSSYVGNIGQDPAYPTRWFNGSIDEVAIYNYPLSPAQIQSHYNARSGFPVGSYPDRVVKDGASAYWRLDETSGTVAKDSIGGFNGTISGGVTLAQAGAIGGNGAMLFNPAGPADGGVTVPVGTYSAFGTGPATIECWFNLPAAPLPAEAAICTTSSPFTGAGLSLHAVPTELQVRTRDTTNVMAHVATPMPLFNQWHHLVGVLRRGANDTVELWLNGVLKSSANRATAGQDITSTASTRIGSLGTSTELTGLIDEVAIYPLALTPAQILAHYNAR